MFRTTPLRRAIVGLSAAFAMTVSLSACGEESGDTGSGTPVPSASADTSLDGVPGDRARTAREDEFRHRRSW